MADFDSLVPDAEASVPQAPPSAHISANPPSGGMSFDDLQDDSEKYGTTSQQAIAGLEGVAKGIAGPLATGFEKNTLHIKPEDIRGRQEANPITHGIGETAGLVGGALTGTGEAAVMSKAARLASEAAGLGEAVTYGAKVGEAVVQQAAEMAVLQSGDEVSKQILQDPNASAQSAIANIGLAAALGGATGGFMTGIASPLWNATAGPKVDELLNMVKNHVNGGGRLAMSDAAESAAKTLGIDVDPVMRSGMSQDAKANTMFGTLRRSENQSVLDGIDKLHTDASNSVMDSLGLNPEDVKIHSENEAGHDLHDTFSKEYKEKYEPVAEALDKRDAESAPIQVPDEDRLGHANKIIEKGMGLGTDSPYFKEYTNYADRLLAKDTIGQMDQLKTEINNRIKGLKIGGDHNVINALNDIKNSIGDFQEAQINKAGMDLAKHGVAEGSAEAAKLIADRSMANAGYAKFAQMSDELMNHLGVGKFQGEATLRSKLANKVAAEDLLKKFSIKGNSDFLPFLKEHFPETLEKIIENERKQLVKPAILSAAKKGENPIDINKMADILQKAQAGKKEYIDAIIPKEAIDKIEAARTLAKSIPSPKDSGTPAGISKIFSMMPTSALAAVGWMTGHGPIASLLFGETANRLGKDIPEAAKLGYLKFLGSNQPVKSEGFKAMVDFFHATAKGESMLAKATKGVLKSGAQVLTESQMPNKADREKLDKVVTKMQTHPNDMLQAQNGHVGHYLPEHQVALTQASSQALQYLQQLKPHPIQISPLDKPIEPTPAQNARYDRALNIAQQPYIVLQHVKQGTIQTSDLLDLKGMYPALYTNIAQKLSNQMTSAQGDEDPIPYRTRVGISLFLGQPLDTSMHPQSIQAAQAINMKPQGPPQPPQNSSKSGRPSALKGKSTNLYKTPGQNAEEDRSNRN